MTMEISRPASDAVTRGLVYGRPRSRAWESSLHWSMRAGGSAVQGPYIGLPTLGRSMICPGHLNLYYAENQGLVAHARRTPVEVVAHGEAGPGSGIAMSPEIEADELHQEHGTPSVCESGSHAQRRVELARFALVVTDAFLIPTGRPVISVQRNTPGTAVRHQPAI